jgi:hypothetical protein
MMLDVNALSFWQMTESAANLFYDPALFWSAPLLLAALWEIYRRSH